LVFRNITPVWLAVKVFQTSWFRVKLVVATIIAITADFTILFTTMEAGGNPVAIGLMLVLVSIGLSAALLHLTKHALYELGVFKALGASNWTISWSLFIRLFITGIVGTLIGTLIGLICITCTSILLPTEVFMIASPHILLSLLSYCILGVLAGALAGVLFMCTKSKMPIAEILNNVR
jgi:ABC-type antimicrobial peptide transport system permease subunit